MAEAEALSKEEQALFESMREEKPEPKADAEKPADKDASSPKETPKEASKDAPKESKEAQKMVPVEAVKEARAQNKELRKEIDELKKIVANGDEKLKRFVEGLSKQAEVQAPKYEEDAAGHLKHETETLRKQNADLMKAIGEVNAKLAAGDKAAKDASALQKFAASVSAREAAFVKENPDYYKAADFVAQIWRDEFEEAGLDAEAIPAAVFQKSIGITQQATAKDKDPAEVIYKIAKRYGWKTPEAKDEAKDKKSDGDTKLQTIAKGLEAAKKAGGGDGPDDTTFASIAQMDDDAIDKLVQDKDWWAKHIRRSALH